jgi:UDP-glucose 4-epimerase
MTWLVIGGAGYIGAHVVHELRQTNRHVVVLDDLSSGDRTRVSAEIPLVIGSTADRSVLRKTFREYDVKGIIFLAGRKSAPDSVAHPLGYFRANVESLRVLLEEMDQFNITSILLSSSAAVYGTPRTPLVTEDSPTTPVNPYGETKLVCEWLLRAVGVACGLSWIALRYFNVVGATDPRLADRRGTSLFPMVFAETTAARPVLVTGTDYPTRDGSGVRDYVHVADVARAHVAAVQRLEKEPSSEIYNVGTGRGYSVLEVVDEIRRATGLPVQVTAVGRRPCDPAEVVASVDRIHRELGWRAQHDLTDMVVSAWQAFATERRN